MELQVRDAFGGLIDVRVQEGTTIGELKSQISSQAEVDPEKQILYFHRQILKDEYQVEQINFGEEPIIYLREILETRNTKKKSTNEENIGQLVSMGYSKERASKALKATSGNITRAANILAENSLE